MSAQTTKQIQIPKKQFHMILQGDVRKSLAQLPNDSVDCVVTSPPYWGLRDYKLPPVVWDGVEGCEHQWGEFIRRSENKRNNDNSLQVESAYWTDQKQAFCSKCSAWKGQLGLEPTFQLYVKHIVDVFHEVKRVLKPTGSLYLNLGDTYNGAKGKSGYELPHEAAERYGKRESLQSPNYQLDYAEARPQDLPQNLPEKCLIGIPERIMLAMIDDGWILRNKLIWHKPNHMPSSVKDRFSNSYEFVYFFVKQPRYYFDLDAVREPHSQTSTRWGGNVMKPPKETKYPTNVKDWAYEVTDKERLWHNPSGKNPGDVIEAPRDYWTINTQPFPESHFAVFPEKLVERPIKASCPKDGIVLDLFAGSGTVALVAKNLGRSSISIELKPEYVEMIKKRIDFGAFTIDNGIEWIETVVPIS